VDSDENDILPPLHEPVELNVKTKNCIKHHSFMVTACKEAAVLFIPAVLLLA
jgi:hypothetical protein